MPGTDGVTFAPTGTDTHREPTNRQDALRKVVCPLCASVSHFNVSDRGCYLKHLPCWLRLSNALPLSGGRPSAADHPLQRLVRRRTATTRQWRHRFLHLGLHLDYFLLPPGCLFITNEDLYPCENFTEALSPVLFNNPCSGVTSECAFTPAPNPPDASL